MRESSRDVSRGPWCVPDHSSAIVDLSLREAHPGVGHKGIDNQMFSDAEGIVIRSAENANNSLHIIDLVRIVGTMPYTALGGPTQSL